MAGSWCWKRVASDTLRTPPTIRGRRTAPRSGTTAHRSKNAHAASAGGVTPRNGSRLAGKHVHSVHSVLASSPFLGGRAETVKTCRDADLAQADLRQVLDELCLRQSAGDSTSPEVDVSAGVFRELEVEGNISQVKATTPLQHPHDLSKSPFLLGDKI
jgi:hypothetical protein